MPVAFEDATWLILSDEEIRRAEQFLFASGRQHYIRGRRILRILLGIYLNTPPQEVSFRYGRNLKPELAPRWSREKLNFNLSHSHGQLLVAIAKDLAVGVDIELVRSNIEIESIAKRFFSSDEINQLTMLEGSDKRQGFFDAWTRKEAYLKAKSEGIGYGLDQFTVSLNPNQPARLLSDRRDPHALCRWDIRALAAAPGYVAALSFEASGSSAKQFSWNSLCLDN